MWTVKRGIALSAGVCSSARCAPLREVSPSAAHSCATNQTRRWGVPPRRRHTSSGPLTSTGQSHGCLDTLTSMRSGDATTKKTNKKETTQNIEVFRTKRDESVTEEPVFVLPLTTKVKYRDVNTIIYID